MKRPFCQWGMIIALCLYGGSVFSSALGNSTENTLGFKTSSDVITTGLIWRIAISLLLITLIGYGVALLVKKYLPLITSYSAGHTSKLIQVTEIRRLTPQLTLILIEVKNQQILLASSGNTITTLKEWPIKTNDAGL